MFYDNLKSICDKKNIKITPLVAECGGAKGSISNWRKGASPNSDIVISLAVRLNVSTDELLLGSPNYKKTSDNHQEMLDLYEKMSDKGKRLVLEWVRALYEMETESLNLSIGKSPTIKLKHSIYKVSAGNGFNLDEGDSWEEIDIPDTPESRKSDLCLTIIGDSMEPVYKDGDIVLVREQAAVDPGQIGIFIIEGKGYIKKYGGDKLISLNDNYDDIMFADYDADSIKCVGAVIGRV
ncbi:MAG: helix-turn-helix transcriptional regulator [Oscillospiraceae bacterium]